MGGGAVAEAAADRCLVEHRVLEPRLVHLAAAGRRAQPQNRQPGLLRARRAQRSAQGGREGEEIETEGEEEEVAVVVDEEGVVVDEEEEEGDSMCVGERREEKREERGRERER